MDGPELRVVFEPEIPAYDPELYRYQTVAKGITGFEAVDEKELAHFRQRGYLAVHEAFSMTRVEAARQELYRLGTSPRPDCESVYFEGAVRRQLPELEGKPVSEPKGRRFADLALGHTDSRLPSLDPATRMRFVRKFMGFTREENPALKSLAEDPSLTRVLSRLLGGQPRLYQDMALIKPPGGREKPWHQDRAYFNLTQATPIVGIWIALDEATPENGCMQVIEGGSSTGSPGSLHEARLADLRQRDRAAPPGGHSHEEPAGACCSMRSCLTALPPTAPTGSAGPCSSTTSRRKAGKPKTRIAWPCSARRGRGVSC